VYRLLCLHEFRFLRIRCNGRGLLPHSPVGLCQQDGLERMEIHVVNSRKVWLACQAPNEFCAMCIFTLPRPVMIVYACVATPIKFLHVWFQKQSVTLAPLLQSMLNSVMPEMRLNRNDWIQNLLTPCSCDCRVVSVYCFYSDTGSLPLIDVANNVRTFFTFSLT